MSAITKAVHAVHPDLPIIPYMTTGATDGRELRAAGIPTYGTTGLFSRSEDSFAHGLNERVPVDVPSELFGDRHRVPLRPSRGDFD